MRSKAVEVEEDLSSMDRYKLFPFFRNRKSDTAEITCKNVCTVLPGHSSLPRGCSNISRGSKDPTAERLHANHTAAATVVLVKAADAIDFASKAQQSCLREWMPPITVKRFSGGCPSGTDGGWASPYVGVVQGCETVSRMNNVFEEM